MLPILIKLGPITIYTFGILIFISLAAGLFAIWRRGRELRFEESELFDLSFVVGLLGLLTARAGYIALNWLDFGIRPLRWINIIGQPGFWYPAGFAGLIIGIYVQAKKRRWDLYSTSDALVVGLTLGLSILSFGAFLNGSGLGGATDSIFGLRFPGLYDKRIPVPLYEAILYIILFKVLWGLEASYRTIPWYRGGKSQAKPGFITSIFLISHGLIESCMILLKPPVLLAGIPIELIWYVALTILGLRILTIQSANTLRGMLQEIFKQLKNNINHKLHAQKDTSKIQFFK